jgi:SAM-dependent methyltransferase
MATTRDDHSTFKSASIIENERMEQIRADYAEAVETGACLCSTSAYDCMDLSFIPTYVRDANQGCSSPLADAECMLGLGDTIVDLGCGAGLDVFLAARLVGREGKAVGIDMTPEMLELANRAAPEVGRSLGFVNTSFYNAPIEALPVANSDVNVVISNCVINLSQDKRMVFAEIFRVLKLGGVFIISDVFAGAPVPESIRNDARLISRCIGGALEFNEFAEIVAAAGFSELRTLHTDEVIRVEGIDFLSMTVSASKR